jgi:hypothetical protein
MSIGFVLLTHHQPHQIDRLLAQLNKMFNYPPIVCHHDFDKCALSVDHLSKNIEFAFSNKHELCISKLSKSFSIIFKPIFDNFFLSALDT